MTVPKPRLGHHWQILRRMVLERDGYKCSQCNSRRRLEVDHIVPVDDGGTDDPDNLQTLCRNCHIRKTRAEKESPWSGSEDWREFAHASRFERNRP